MNQTRYPITESSYGFDVWDETTGLIIGEALSRRDAEHLSDTLQRDHELDAADDYAKHVAICSSTHRPRGYQCMYPYPTI